MFVPIGNFILLEDGSTSVLNTDHVSPQVQELVLKQPIQKVKSLSAIKDGHSVDSYFKKLNVNSKENEGCTASRDIVHDSFFKPHVEGKPSVIWTRKEDGGKRCQLAARGRYLKSLQMSSKLNMFSGLPFKSTSKCVNVSEFL